MGRQIQSRSRKGGSDGGRNCPRLSDLVVMVPIDMLVEFPGHARVHPDKQQHKLNRSISRFGVVKPVITDELKTILLGHACVRALRDLGHTEVPTLTLSGLTQAEKKALILADAKIAEEGEWHAERLKIQLMDLLGLDIDIELTGFSTCEVDNIIIDDGTESDMLAGDGGPSLEPDRVITEKDYVWILGVHRVICGNSLESQVLIRLLGEDKVQLVVTDTPYNVKIQGHARGRSKKRHREFAMASGEMSDPQFVDFLVKAMLNAIRFSTDGSIHYWFIDWRHLPQLLQAALPQYSEWKNLLVWRKANAGQGSFYRSHHELIPVFKSGTAAHINNFGLGAEGRYRTNVLDYPGGATPDATRQAELAMHPTVKPVSLIADLIRDCSERDGLVLDLFGGSGTTLLAAERTGRRARLVELDPAYVDLTVRRWQQLTGRDAILEGTGKTFNQIAQEKSNAEKA